MSEPLSLSPSVSPFPSATNLLAAKASITEATEAASISTTMDRELQGATTDGQLQNSRRLFHKEVRGMGEATKYVYLYIYIYIEL